MSNSLNYNIYKTKQTNKQNQTEKNRKIPLRLDDMFTGFFVVVVLFLLTVFSTVHTLREIILSTTSSERL